MLLDWERILFVFPDLYTEQWDITMVYFCRSASGHGFVSRDVQPSSGVLCRKIFAVSRKDDIIFYKKVEILLFTM